MTVSHVMPGDLWQAIRSPTVPIAFRQYVTVFLMRTIHAYNGRRKMKKITVCIGSSCHLKGSRQVVEMLQYFIAQNKLDDKVELTGTFCMGQCQKGVCVTVDDQFFSVTPDTVKDFFDKEILAKL
jgi:NADH:ubiquinone oxidoreductase subunit E